MTVGAGMLGGQSNAIRRDYPTRAVEVAAVTGDDQVSRPLAELLLAHGEHIDAAVSGGERPRGTANGGLPAYLLFIEGATHSAYQGKATGMLLAEQPTTEVREIQDAVATGTLVFLAARLRAKTDAFDLLNGSRRKDTIPGKVRYEHK